MLSRKNWVLSRTGGALSRTARSVEIVSLCLQLRHAAMDRGREGRQTGRFNIKFRRGGEKRREGNGGTIDRQMKKKMGEIEMELLW